VDSLDEAQPAQLKQRLVSSHPARRSADENETFNFEHQWLRPTLERPEKNGAAVVSKR
jgi:hypothetical protein